MAEVSIAVPFFLMRWPWLSQLNFTGGVFLKVSVFPAGSSPGPLVTAGGRSGSHLARSRQKLDGFKHRISLALGHWPFPSSRTRSLEGQRWFGRCGKVVSTDSVCVLWETFLPCGVLVLVVAALGTFTVSLLSWRVSPRCQCPHVHTQARYHRSAPRTCFPNP